MLKIITGPRGCIAYLQTRRDAAAVYPTLSVPSRSFAGRPSTPAANALVAPAANASRRRDLRGAAIAMLGDPVKRDG